MSEHKDYKIISTRPNVYLNKLNQAVNGFQITVEFTNFDELHLVDVADLDSNTVSTTIENLLAKREALANLGE